MRRPLACLLLVLGAGVVFAAGRILDRTPAANRPSSETTEAQNYAQQMLYVLNQVAEQYVRPVSRAELAGAALHGMYDAVRVPAPAGLDRDVRRATTDQALLALLARTRDALGNAEELHESNALLASCRALTRCLDPHSAVVTGPELRRGSGVDEQQGIGVELEDSVGVGPLRIKAVLPGGPAQQAGLRPGDEITELDGESVQGMPSEVALLRCNFLPGGPPVNPDDPPPATIRVGTRRPGSGEARTVTLERREWQPETVLGVRRRPDNPWDYWLDRPGGVALARLANLGNGTALELREVLTGLQADRVRGLVLDLRWCPGGYLREAVETASLFLGDCNVATLRSRKEPDGVQPSTRDNKFLDLPLVVLVNGETSGGGELIAAALQDRKRAAVVGQRTLGKASIQTMIALAAPGAGLKLTTGTFVRPSGKNLHRFADSKPTDDWGVRPDPDHEFRTSPDLARQLRAWWLVQTLRPGPSREALPLDDPTADPQLQAALSALSRQIDARAASVSERAGQPAR
jgi:carboxyl-terminal processing protease